MPKLLILNADDYGWDKAATDGILELLALNKLSSVSVMVNVCTDADLSALAPYNKDASIGLHVVLNEGLSMVKKENNSLTGEQFQFHSSKTLFTKALVRQITYNDVYTELKAQRDRLLDFGLSVTHADSHQHIHQYPIIGPMILNALKELGIQRIRNSRPLNVYDTRRFILNAFCSFTQHSMNAFRHPDVLITDFTNVHVDIQKQVRKVFESLKNTPHQQVEWMCHPALEDRQGSYLKRKHEFDFLKRFDWNDLLQTYGYRIGNYHEV